MLATSPERDTSGRDASGASENSVRLQATDGKPDGKFSLPACDYPKFIAIVRKSKVFESGHNKHPPFIDEPSLISPFVPFLKRSLSLSSYQKSQINDAKWSMISAHHLPGDLISTLCLLAPRTGKLGHPAPLQPEPHRPHSRQVLNNRLASMAAYLVHRQV